MKNFVHLCYDDSVSVTENFLLNEYKLSTLFVLCKIVKIKISTTTESTTLNMKIVHNLFVMFSSHIIIPTRVKGGRVFVFIFNSEMRNKWCAFSLSDFYFYYVRWLGSFWTLRCVKLLLVYQIGTRLQI